MNIPVVVAVGVVIVAGVVIYRKRKKNRANILKHQPKPYYNTGNGVIIPCTALVVYEEVKAA
jgi:hypothetical protein